MTDTDTIQLFLTTLVTAEMADEDHWLLTDIFYRAVPKKSHFERFFDDKEACVHRSVVYDWWGEYLTENVSNEFLRTFLTEQMYDEYIYSFLNAIYDKYESFIEQHYEEMEN